MAFHTLCPETRVDAWGKAVCISLIFTPLRKRPQGKQDLVSCFLLTAIPHFETSPKIPEQNNIWCAQRLGDGKVKEFTL